MSHILPQHSSNYDTEWWKPNKVFTFSWQNGTIWDFWDFFLPGQLKKKENNSVKNGTAGNFSDNWLEKQHRLATSCCSCESLNERGVQVHTWPCWIMHSCWALWQHLMNEGGRKVLLSGLLLCVYFYVNPLNQTKIKDWLKCLWQRLKRGIRLPCKVMRHKGSWCCLTSVLANTEPERVYDSV